MASEGRIIENEKMGCLTCRIIRGVGCLGIGTYLIFNGRHLKGLNKKTVYVIGGCFSILGMANLLDINISNKLKFM